MTIKLKLILAVALLIGPLFSGTPRSQTTEQVLVDDAELKEQLKLGPCKNSERLEAVKKFFQQMGAAESDIMAEKIKDVQNVIVTKKGKTEEIVIIGAHYDKVGDGCGTIDNWTGIVIIGNLYRALRNAESEKTYIFVAFDKEEVGLVGSAKMASSIPKERRASYCSMVNLDSFGFSYPQVLTNASNPKMTALAKELAAELKMPTSSASLAGVADADSTSFVRYGIPAITFHGLSNKWSQYLHSSNDKLEHINVSSVRVGYNFLLQYVKKLDSSACGIFRK